MIYTVLIMPTAEQELEDAYDWLFAQSPLNAPAWHDGLVDAILSLENSPARCPLAPESNVHEQIRQLLYGNRQHAYRILFRIRNEQVLVLHIVHAARSG